MSTQGIVLLSVVPMRASPSDQSEMTNQVLFGELFTILESEEKWSKIRLHHDGYEGWISNKQWVDVDPELLNTCHLNSSHYAKAYLKDTVIYLPLGARLWNYSKNRGGWKGFKYKTKAKPVDIVVKTKTKRLLKTAYYFLGAPYLWGGRTISGVDCSGFVQSVFALNGCQLPRDAAQQAAFGVAIEFNDAKTGDLAFFQNLEGKIVHVGIVITEKKGTKKIIHSSGCTRIDYLNEEGIFIEENAEGKTFSHQIHSIRRVFE